MPLCAKCQREAPEGALFCPFCSAPILTSQGAAEASDPLIGQTIKGTYLVQQKIGGGGMGQVYKAVQINLDRPVALKLLRPSLLSDQTIVQRFHREARAASKLHHPNVISVTDFGQIEDGTLFMAMEYVPGRNLLKLMRDEFPLGERRVIHLVGQILSALAEAHGAGIVHRDLKPENVMVESRRDEPDFVKVLDFGIAKIQEPDERQERLTQTGLIFGTPDYMSPEQATLVPLDARSDLYSVGVMLYEMLTGRHPFEAATPPAMAQAHVVQTPPPMAERCLPGHAVSPALEAIVTRALAKNPEDRFQTAEEMRRELLDCPLELGQGVADPERFTAPPPGRPTGTPASMRSQSLSSPAGLPKSATPPRAGPPATEGRVMTPHPSTPPLSPAPHAEVARQTPSGRRPVALTEPLLREPPRRPPSEPPTAQPRTPARSRLPLAIASGGLAVLAVGGFLVFGRSAGEKAPRPSDPVEVAGPKEKPAQVPTPQELLKPPPAPGPEPKPAPEGYSVPSPPQGERDKTDPLPASGERAKEEASTATGEPTPSTAAPSRKVKRKRPVVTPTTRRPAHVTATAEAASQAAPPRIATPRATPTASAAAPPSTSAPPAPSSRPEAFVTREVLGFQQVFGDPGLKGRGRGLVDKARWLLEPNGTFTFAPAEKAPGFFPMTVHAAREGNRVWFEGSRTARASDGLAYVRISGDLALAAADRMLTVDLEFGRARGPDGVELEPTYRARARLRLAPE